MRILQVHTRYRERGGEDAVVDSDRDLLVGAGHEVLRHEARNPDDATAAARRMAVAPWNPAARRELRDIVRRDRPDVAHVHNTWFSLSPSAVVGLKDAGVPVVMTVHNYRLVCANGQLFRDGRPCQDCVGSHPWHGTLHRCYRGSAASSFMASATIAASRARDVWVNNVDRFLVLNEFGRSILLKGGFPDSKLSIRPNVVADPGPRPAPPSASDTVLFVGRLSEDKGVRTLVEAWRRAQPRGLRLDVVGEGDLRAELEADAPANVRFRGWLASSEVHAAMRFARALFFPSMWYEGQPIVLLEAFASGLPVVASDLGGPGNEVGELDPDSIVTAGDVDAWAHAIDMVGVGTALDALGVLGRARYEAHYTPEVGLRGLEDAYASVLACRP